MNPDEQERCGMPGPGGLTCGLPLDHEGLDHAFEAELPLIVQQMIARHVDALEESKAKLDKALRYARWIKWMWFTLLVFYLFLTVIKMTA